MFRYSEPAALANLVRRSQVGIPGIGNFLSRTISPRSTPNWELGFVGSTMDIAVAPIGSRYDELDEKTLPSIPE